MNNHSSAFDKRPIDPTTGKPMTATEQPGYYPGFSTLAQQSFWDEATRKTILKRMHQVPSIRFFTKEQAELMELVVEHLLPQHDRLPSRRIPIVPHIDKRLFSGHIPGYRFEKMPPDWEAYRLALQGIEQMAQHGHKRKFADLSWPEQELLLKSIHDGKPMDGAAEIWDKMSIDRCWAMFVGDCVEAYYAHPWAWDEIGFGGPAYPRGYMRLERGEPEPWETEEQRYSWAAPLGVISDDPDGEATHSEHPPAGQGGTH